MSGETIIELAREQLEASDGSKEKKLLLGALADEMYEISDDPQGTELEDYFQGGDLKTLKEFLKMATDLGWPGALPKDMLTTWVPGMHAWTSPMRTAKDGLSRVLFFRRAGDTNRGYEFGRLNMVPAQRVAICEDGLLRSYRDSELIKSKGLGWGKLPNPERVRSVIKPERKLIKYGHDKYGHDIPLEKRLLAQIGAENLRHLVEP